MLLDQICMLGFGQTAYLHLNSTAMRSFIMPVAAVNTTCIHNVLFLTRILAVSPRLHRVGGLHFTLDCS